MPDPSVSPPINNDWPNPYAPLLQIVIPAPVSSALALELDGGDILPDTSTYFSGGDLVLEYNVPGFPGRNHTVYVQWDDGVGPLDYSAEFRQGPEWIDHTFAGPPYWIEAEDFNTEAGQYFPSNPSFGHSINAQGLYVGKTSTETVDFNSSGAAADLYRVGTGVSFAAHDDENVNGVGSERGFSVATDYKISGLDPATDWFNYTRTFPAGRYHCWARMAGSTGNMGGELGEVVSDRSVAGQTVNTLGYFFAAANGNTDEFQFVPLVDGDYELIILELDGETTLRFTAGLDGGELQYLMFTEVPEIPNIEGGGEIVFSVSGALGGTRAAVGSMALVFGDTGTLRGDAALPGTLPLVFSAGTGTLMGFAPIVGTVQLVFSETGTVGGAGNLALVGDRTILFGTPAPFLEGGGLLGGAVALVFGNAATLSGDGATIGEAALVFGSSGDLSGPTSLGGTAALVFGVAGVDAGLAAEGDLEAVVALVFGVEGVPSGAGNLPPGTAGIVFGTAGALPASGALTASVVPAGIVFGTAGTLPGSGDLEAEIALVFGTFTSAINVSVEGISGTVQIVFGAGGGLKNANRFLPPTGLPNAIVIRGHCSSSATQSKARGCGGFKQVVKVKDL